MLFETLRHLVGNQTFLEVIQSYVSDNKFGAVEDVDLYRTFDRVLFLYQLGLICVNFF